MKTVVESFLPRIWAVASSFTKIKEDQAELVQEAAIQLIKATKNKEMDSYQMIDKIIRNAMLMQMRQWGKCETTRWGKKTKRSVEELADPEQLENLYSAPDQEEAVRIRESVREICRLLPDLERRILQELIDPSEEFRWFSRKKSAIKNITKLRYNVADSRPKHELLDPTLCEFFNVKTSDLKLAISRIQKIAKYQRVALF